MFWGEPKKLPIGGKEISTLGDEGTTCISRSRHVIMHEKGPVEKSHVRAPDAPAPVLLVGEEWGMGAWTRARGWMCVRRFYLYVQLTSAGAAAFQRREPSAQRYPPTQRTC